MTYKILYGVQGTGNGHISRTRMMAKFFQQHDVDVTYLFSGRDEDQFFDMDIFGDYLYRKGFTLYHKAGKIDFIPTTFKNSFYRLIKDIRQLDLSQYDLIISDFEPVTAWAAKLQKKPIIGTGHQYAIGPNTPTVGDNMVSNLIMKYFAPIKTTIGQHWYPYEQNTLPPIVNTSLSATESHGKYVVYLPFEDQQSMTQVLNQFPAESFIQYSPELKDGRQGNVETRKTQHDAFKRDLCGAKGVICNSGFELNSECIHLGLPVLTKPLAGQMEQLSNAKVLVDLGYAEAIDEVTVDNLAPWLNKEKVISPSPLPNVAEETVKWILKGEWQDITPLREKLWQDMIDLDLELGQQDWV